MKIRTKVWIDDDKGNVIFGSGREHMLEAIERLHLEASCLPTGLCLYEAGWHQGVIGILASRIKEQFHRPVIAFAQAGDGELKGSARSVAGLHVRDALDAIASGPLSPDHTTFADAWGIEFFQNVKDAIADFTLNFMNSIDECYEMAEENHG